MSSTLPRVDSPGDAELIAAVRGGDVDAYGELFARHVDAARRLARQLVSAGDVDDLVSDAFAKVLSVLQRGGGPDLSFRAYLLTALRRLHVDRVRAGARLRTTDDLAPFDPGVPFRDTAVEGFESAAAARAFASLPERWQMVLWHTEVEGQRPAEVAPLLGMSANSVSALAYRAREGLRQAFLGMHAREVDDETCRWVHQNLGAYVRNGVSRRDATRVEEHLTGCRACAAVYLELTEVNDDLAGLVAPLLLGGAAAAYVGSGGAGAGGGLLLLLDRLRELAAGHAPATAVAGVTAAAVVGGAVLLTLEGDGGRTEARPGDLAGEARTRGPADAGDDPGRGPGDGRRREGTARVPAEAGAATAAEAAAPAPPAQTPNGPAPTAAPADGPAGPGPSAPSSGAPSQPGPPAAVADLAVRAAADRTAPGTFEVRVVVSGLPQGATGTLSVTARGASLTVTGDPRCGRPAVGSATCEVTTSPATYRMTAVAAPAGDPALVLTVSHDGPATDPDPGNNRVVVALS